MEATADFTAQLRNARAQRYRKGTEERRGDLWECGAGGIEQALWVQKQEQHMSDCFQEIFWRAKEALNAQTNVAIAAPNRPREERSALQQSIQPQETAAPNRPRAQDSVPPPSIQPRESAAPNRKREKDRAPQTSVQPDESAAPNRRREEMGALQQSIQTEESAAPNRRREERTTLHPSVHGAPGSTSPSIERTQEFWTNLVISLEAMEVTMTSEQTKARGKRTRCRKKKV